MPILYFIGMIFFGITYFINKGLIIKYYRFSTTLSKTIPITVLQFIKYSLIFHVIVGLFMLTNQTPFMTRDMSPLQGQGVYELQMDPSSYLKSLEEEAMAGNEVITGNTQSQKFLARFEMVHQQIYICFLAVFVFFLLVYKTLISILEILVVFVFYSFRKVFELLSACLQRLYKRVVCKLQNQEFVDSIESFKITDSDENLDSESESEVGLNDSEVSLQLDSQDLISQEFSNENGFQEGIQEGQKDEEIKVQEVNLGNEGDNDEEGIKGLQDSGDIILKKLEDSKQQILDHSVKTLKLIDRKSSSILDRIEKDKQKLLSGGLDNVNILQEAKNLKALIEDSKASKKKKKEMQRARREILLQAQKQKEKLIMQKRMSVLDFSDNILVEFNMISLSNFYERAQRELQDFFHSFNLNDGLTSKVINPDSQSFCRVHFLENLYMNHLTQEQVVKYVNILQRRLKDIEKVIDRHFKMIHPYIIKDVEQIFENQRIQRAKAGRQLDLDEEVKLNDKLEMALRSHPDVQFHNEQYYTYNKKLQKLISHQDNLIEADINRKENRMASQTICRMTGSHSQSYYIFDSVNYKIARKIYFSIEHNRSEQSNEEFGETQELEKNIRHLQELQENKNIEQEQIPNKKSKKKKRVSNKVRAEQEI